MKIIFRFILIATTCLGLAGCGPDAGDYIGENIALWNRASDDLSAMQGRVNGLKELKAFAGLASSAADNLQASEQRLKEQEMLQAQNKIPKGGEALQAATIAYLEKSVEMYRSLQTLARVASTGTEAAMLTQQNTFAALFHETQQKAEALVKAQDSFAKAHKITVNTESANGK